MDENLKAAFPDLPDWVDEEKLRRVLTHYKDGAFEFDLRSGELVNFEGNTVYHIVPHYADEGEEFTDKLRRIMRHEMEEENEQ